MRKTYKLALTIASFMLIAVAVTTMGVSYAVWTSSDGTGSGGQKTVSPSVTPYQNYVWAKYFGFEVIEGNDVAVTEFYIDRFNDDSSSSDSVGINLQDVYIPDVFWEKADGSRVYTLSEKDALDKKNVEYTTYKVVKISNRLFKDSSLKELPVTIHIPQYVTSVATGAFVSLPNLEKVVFYNNQPVTVEMGAFVNCPKLTSIQKGTNEVNLLANAVIGCGTYIVS